MKQYGGWLKRYPNAIPIAAFIGWASPQSASAWHDPHAMCIAPPARKAMSTEPLCAVGDIAEDDMHTSAPAAIPSTLQNSAPTPINADAATLFASYKKLVVESRQQEAVAALNRLEELRPRIQDRFALLEGDLFLSTQQPDAACKSFAIASDSPHSAIAARGRVGAVRCLLQTGDKKAEREFDKLFKKYPEVADAGSLRLDFARAKERWGDSRGALAVYRRIDLLEPGSPEAAVARLAIESLAKAGIVPTPWTTSERFTRVENLIHWNMMTEARVMIDALRSENLASGQRQHLENLVGRMVRLAPGSITTTAQEAASLSASDTPADSDALEKLRKLNTKRLPLLKIRSYLQMASALRAQDIADQLVTLAANFKRIPAPLRLELVALAEGTATDDKLIPLIEPLTREGRYKAAGHYHWARALERSGQSALAQPHYQAAIDADRGLMFYTFLSRQRLSTLMRHKAPTPAETNRVAGNIGSSSKPGTTAKAIGPSPQTVAETTMLSDLDRRAAMENLKRVMARHDSAFPWLGRAIDLIELGELDAASDEIYEVYLAWRGAVGKAAPRAGLEAVYCGRACTRKVVDKRLRRMRSALDDNSRKLLADVAWALGDVGTAPLFDGRDRIAGNPRAYEAFVRQAAQERQIDPELLWAVMRTESAFQKRIVSYAGAVGLMQIMPRTGTLIAANMRQPAFTPSLLLDPSVNIRMAAWYLSSLLKRFDGSVPLALAGYNGGPHNVRRWMQSVNPTMPMDAFVELIPFGQTHHYVRRVLTYYAAYAAQSGKEMPAIAMNLPAVTPPDPTAF